MTKKEKPSTPPVEKSPARPQPFRESVIEPDARRDYNEVSNTRPPPPNPHRDPGGGDKDKR